MPRQLPQDSESFHVEFIRNVGNWPHWPRLPMKRRDRGQQPDLGVLIPFERGWVLFYANLYQKIEESTPSKVYDSPEAVVMDGWVVD